MKSSLFFVLVCSFFASIGFLPMAMGQLVSPSESFEFALSKQTEKTISPIEYQGLPVYGVPAQVCMMLGFDRTVSHISEEIEFAAGTTVGLIKAVAVPPEVTTTKLRSKMKLDILKSVTCAK